MTHHHQFDSVVILATTFVTATVITSFVVTMGVMTTLAVIRDVMAVVVVVVVMGLNRYFRILAWLVWLNLVKNSNFHTFGSMINFHRSFNLVALFAATKT